MGRPAGRRRRARGTPTSEAPPSSWPAGSEPTQTEGHESDTWRTEGGEVGRYERGEDSLSGGGKQKHGGLGGARVDVQCGRRRVLGVSGWLVLLGWCWCFVSVVRCSVLASSAFRLLFWLASAPPLVQRRDSAERKRTFSRETFDTRKARTANEIKEELIRKQRETISHAKTHMKSEFWSDLNIK